MTPRQKAFIAAYAGNATQAARDAGYKGSDATLGQTGHELLKNPEVAAAIAARTTKREAALIASREEVEEQLTAFVRDDKLNVGDKLKAIGTLAKMRGWNLSKVVLEGRVTWEQLIMQAERKTANGSGVVAQVEPAAGRKAAVPGVEDSPGLPKPRAPKARDEGGG